MKFLGPFFILISALGIVRPVRAVPTTDPDYAGVLFAGRIWPLMADKCLACHGKDEDKIKGGLDLRTFASAREGGDSEKPSIVPGKPEESPFYLAVTRAHETWESMPPKENDRLSPEQIGWIKQWIEAGAPWPESEQREKLAKRAEVWSTADGVMVKTSPAESAEWQNRRYDPAALWAFQPVKKPVVPAGSSVNPVDGFINAKLARNSALPPESNVFHQLRDRGVLGYKVNSPRAAGFSDKCDREALLDAATIAREKQSEDVDQCAEWRVCRERKRLDPLAVPRLRAGAGQQDARKTRF